MKIRLLSPLTVDGVAHPKGDVVDVSPEEAAKLIGERRAAHVTPGRNAHHFRPKTEPLGVPDTKHP